jgi:hypothetical protein
MPGTCSIPILCSIKQEMTVIQPLLLSGDCLRVQTAVRLIGKIYVCTWVCLHTFSSHHYHWSAYSLKEMFLSVKYLLLQYPQI